MAPLNVVHVVRQFAPAIGGLEEAVLKLGLALQDQGVASSIVTLDRIAQDPAAVLPRADTVGGLPVTRIPFTGSWRYPLAPSVLAHVGAADVVHVHAIDFFFDFLAVTKLLHRKPLVASTHGGFFHTRFAARLKQVYFQTATRASSSAYDAICASSRSDFSLFRRIAPRNVRLVENGVDTAKWAGLAPREPRRRLLAIGRFASHKRLPRLFPLLAALRDQHPGWQLTIAGSPWDVPPGELRQAAVTAGVDEAVEIVVGSTDPVLAEIIRTSSYILSASSHEGFGLSVVEGMAAGLVPVLSDIQAFRDLLARCDCGRLMDVDDPVAAAAAIEQMHRHNLSQPGEAQAAAVRSAGQFSWSAAAELFQQHYRAARDRRGPVARFHEAPS